MNYYEQLKPNQIGKIYQTRSRQIANYLGIYSEKGHLDKYLITLSPIENTIEATIEIRREFINKLKSKIKYKKCELGYFSTIEIALNKENPSVESKVYELERLKDEKTNFHIHIQLFTNIDKKDLEAVLEKLDISKVTYKTLTSRDTSIDLPPEYRYIYVVKELYKINWKLQCYVKNFCKNKILYTSSQKSIPNYLITKLWNYMQSQYKDKWNNIGDKYAFILNTINNKDIILSNTNNEISVLHNYNRVMIKHHIIDIKKNIL